MSTARRIAKDTLVLPSQAQAPGCARSEPAGAPDECLKIPAAYVRRMRDRRGAARGERGCRVK